MLGSLSDKQECRHLAICAIPAGHAPPALRPWEGCELLHTIARAHDQQKDHLSPSSISVSPSLRLRALHTTVARL